MRLLLKNGTVVNVFTGELEKNNILIEDKKIIGVGDYFDEEADVVEDISGKFVCPGFIDGHIHIESTMLIPSELAKIALPNGTTSIVADPHEIANVCGKDGINFMLKSSEELPLNVYIMLPSCVPSTGFDESGAELKADDLREFYSNERVLGLAEMMNYPGVINDDCEILKKIDDAYSNNRIVDGHAPLLSGKDLDKYISAGIQSDHECSSFDEAVERIGKGQWVMIRQGTAARNLDGLIDLFDEPYCKRCLLVTDDRHPADLIKEGHIDNIIRLAVRKGKSVVKAIQMATIQAAQCFGIKYVGAVAPGYRADLLVLKNLENVEIEDVYSSGRKVVSKKIVWKISAPKVEAELLKTVKSTFNVEKISERDLYIVPNKNKCRVIKTIPNQLLTEELITEINYETNNGIDINRDILKIAVIERHKNTGHKGIGFISGIGLKSGAIASSISHDSHNIVVIGTNDKDIAYAVNCIIDMQGGAVCVKDEKIIAEMPLNIAGLMTEEKAEVIAEKNENLRNAIYSLGVPENIAPLMTMAFVSLSVIPNLKMTTRGLVDVNKQELVSLFAD